MMVRKNYYDGRDFLFKVENILFGFKGEMP